MSERPDETQRTWDILKQVATRTLDRKRRLGESAIVWQDGRPVITAGDMTTANSASSPTAGRSASDD